MSGPEVQSIETVLGPEVWRPRQAAHRARGAAFGEARRRRAEAGEREPVEDFLFTYYPFRLSALQRWTPGAGVALAQADELLTFGFFEEVLNRLASDELHAALRALIQTKFKR